MLASFDMNGFNISNLGTPASDNDAVRLVDLRNAATAGIPVTDAQSMFAVLADLQASSLPSTTVLVYVGGFYTAGDGGGGFYRRLQSTPSHSSYVVDHLGGIWGLSEFRPTLKQFGAKCDGTTDDLAAWNKAFLYGSSVSFGGVTRTSSTIFVPSNFTITGGGYQDRVKPLDALGDIPTFSNATVGPTTTGGRNVNIVMSNFTIDGNRSGNPGAGQNSHGVNLQAVQGFTFYGWIENCHGDAIYLGSSQTTQTVGCEDINIQCRGISNTFRQGVTCIMVKRARIQVDFATGVTQQVVDIEPNNANNLNSDIDIRILKADTNGSGVLNSVVGIDGLYNNVSNVSVYIEYVSNQTGLISSFRGAIDGLRIDGIRWDCTNGANAVFQFDGASGIPTNISIGPVVIEGSGNSAVGSGLMNFLAVDTISVAATLKNCGKSGTGVFNCSGTQNFLFTGKIINPGYIGIYLNGGCVNSRILNATIQGTTDRAVYISGCTYTTITSCDLSNNTYTIYEASATDYGTYRNNNCSGSTHSIILVGSHSSQYSNKGIAAPTVSGSRSGGTALTNLLAMLQTEEIITDGTSA